VFPFSSAQLSVSGLCGVSNPVKPQNPIMKTIIQTLLRVLLVLCILAMLVASTLSILPSGVALVYMVCLTITIMLTYV
jgi:hypothetical protein